MSQRSIQRLIPAREATEGAGVRIKRSLGQSPGARLDPFLLLDTFFSDNPDDYLAGFPEHPHRGFETVTYMLEGHMLHEDHLGNRGDLRDGGAQWMTAGRGIIHSEMPQQSAGRMRGFQLWINLPAAEKLQPPGYRDVQAEEFPQRELPGGGRAIFIAGDSVLNGEPARGFFNGLDERSFSTDPVYLDLRLARNDQVEIGIPGEHNAFIQVYEGEVTLGEQAVGPDIAAVLDRGEHILLHAGDRGARLLLLAARPTGEPVVQYGPFVMNTNEEIEQALRDYRDGRLTSA